MRPPTPADAPAVAALIAACQAANGAQPTATADEVLSDWSGIDLAEEAIVIADPGGDLVASADLANRRYVQGSVYGYVHPDRRGQGLGTALVRWGEDWLLRHQDRAPRGARIVAQHYLRSTDAPAQSLLAAHGYAHVRTIFVMAIALDEPPPAPAWPAGLAARDFVPGQDERATFDALEEAFQDMWERPPGDFARWLDLTAAERGDPDLWTLAIDQASGAVAGVCLAKAIGSAGWIGSVGVRRPWRGRGVGLTLLNHNFRAFHRRGIRDIRLSVDADSATGAPRLYRRAGMHPTEEYWLHRKELRAGRLLGAEGLG